MTGDGRHLDDGALSAHVDGELAPDEQAAASVHLDGCAACAERYARLERLSAGLKGLARPEASEAAIAELLDRARQRADTARRPAWLPILATAASLLFGALLVHRALNVEREPTGIPQSAARPPAPAEPGDAGESADTVADGEPAASREAAGESSARRAEPPSKAERAKEQRLAAARDLGETKRRALEPLVDPAPAFGELEEQAASTPDLAEEGALRDAPAARLREELAGEERSAAPAAQASGRSAQLQEPPRPAGRAAQAETDADEAGLGPSWSLPPDLLDLPVLAPRLDPDEMLEGPLVVHLQLDAAGRAEHVVITRGSAAARRALERALRRRSRTPVSLAGVPLRVDLELRYRLATDEMRWRGELVEDPEPLPDARR